MMESNSIELVRHFRTQLNQIPEPANSERATSEYVLKVELQTFFGQIVKRHLIY